MTNHRGMVPREEWARTEIHKASRYSCLWCGKEFAMPHDFYDHLDTEHPKRKAAKKEATDGH